MIATAWMPATDRLYQHSVDVWQQHGYCNNLDASKRWMHSNSMEASISMDAGNRVDAGNNVDASNNVDSSISMDASNRWVPLI